MKIARMISLAALAALALMASLGAGSASATETALCESGIYSPYCKSEDRYPAETALKASATALTMETSYGDIACSESTLEGKTGAEAGEPLPISVSGLTLAGCKVEGTNCTTEAKNLPYAGSLSWGKGANGTLALGNGGKGQPGLFVSCKFYIHCTFALPSIEAQGGAPAHLVVSDATLTPISGVLCPGPGSTLSTDYTVNSPQPAYVGRTDKIAVFCKVNEEPCSPANTFTEGTPFKAENKVAGPLTDQITFRNSEGPMLHCESEIEGTIGATVGTTQRLTISNWTLRVPGEWGYCWNALDEGQCAEQNALDLPYQAALGTDHRLAIAGARFDIYCGGGTSLDCTYSGRQSVADYGLSGSGLIQNFLPGLTPELTFSNIWNLNESGVSCPGSEPKMTGHFMVTEPEGAIYQSWK